MAKQFTLYVDESGSVSLNPKDAYPFFAMGGVIVGGDDKEVARERIRAFKKRWKITYPLHGNEIRSQKKNFAWLALLKQENPEEFEKFLAELEATIVGLPAIVHGCVISRPGYIAKYGQEYGVNIWEMRKTAFSILVERAAKYADRQGGTLNIVFEKCGSQEDELVIQHFEALRAEGTPFHAERSSRYSPLAAASLAQVLTTVEGQRKDNLLLQAADLCLYPIVRIKDQPENRAYHKMVEHELLVDCHLSGHDVDALGIKYFRFDAA